MTESAVAAPGEHRVIAAHEQRLRDLARVPEAPRDEEIALASTI